MKQNKKQNNGYKPNIHERMNKHRKKILTIVSIIIVATLLIGSVSQLLMAF